MIFITLKKYIKILTLFSPYEKCREKPVTGKRKSFFLKREDRKDLVITL